MHSNLRSRLIALALLLRAAELPGEHRARLWQEARGALNADSGAQQPSSLPAQLGLPPAQRLAWQEREASEVFRRELALAEAWAGGKRHCLLLGDAAYPDRLLELPDPPLALWCEGEIDTLVRPQLAMVGSRRATRSGRRLAEMLASDLGAAGFCITSGMAVGIDGAAHAACLARGYKTIAVLGSGPDQNYPRPHTQLRRELVDSGCVISEYPPGTPPLAYHFPERNRLISALSLAVLVVEASGRSGSLITARCALELGREVFAVPGSPLSQVSQGCHRLLRDGAQLVETAEDVLNGLPDWVRPEPAPATPEPTSPADADLTELEQRLLAQLDTNPLPLDRLLQRMDAPVQEISQALVELELKQLIGRDGGGLVRLYR